jgi:pilus assembly protein CpaE
VSIRVLLGIADKDLVMTIGGLTRELTKVEVIGVEPTSADVISAVAGGPLPDVVFVHENLGPFPALDLVRELAMRRPQMAVVLIAKEMSAETFGAAMTAGARGVITGQPALAELENRIDEAAEWAHTMRRHFDPAYADPMIGGLGMIVAFSGAKGGTGTTTLAVQLAQVTATAGRNVCLVDMDLQKGDLSSYLDVSHRRSIVDMVAAAGDLDGAILAEALYLHPDGPHVLLAPPEGEKGDDLPAGAARQIRGALRSRYDLVIVDCGAHLSAGSAMAVELADRVLIAATPDLPSLRGAKRLARMWGRLQLRRAEDVSVVLVRHNKRNEIQPDFARKVLGLSLLRTTVPAAFRVLEEAANTGSPKAATHPAYRKAIAELAKETGVLTDEPQRPDPSAKKEPKKDARKGDKKEPKKRTKEGAAARDKGAALTEFAAIVPLIGLLLLIVWQSVLVGLTSTYASHAANEAARAVAVLGYDTPAARAEVRRRTVARVDHGWGHPRRLRVAVDGGYVRVTIATPAVLPAWRTPFGVSARSKIVYEGEDS